MFNDCCYVLWMGVFFYGNRRLMKLRICGYFFVVLLCSVSVIIVDMCRKIVEDWKLLVYGGS